MRLVLIDEKDNQIANLELPEAMIYGLNETSRFWIHEGRWQLVFLEWRHVRESNNQLWQPFAMVKPYHWGTKH